MGRIIYYEGFLFECQSFDAECALNAFERDLVVGESAQQIFFVLKRSRRSARMVIKPRRVCEVGIAPFGVIAEGISKALDVETSVHNTNFIVGRYPQ